MNYSLSYGFTLKSRPHEFILTPLTQKTIANVVSAAYTHSSQILFCNNGSSIEYTLKVFFIIYFIYCDFFF